MPATSAAEPFAARIVAAPRAFDPALGAEAAARLGVAGAAADLVRGAAGSSPFLARLIAREAEWLADALDAPPEAALDGLLTVAGDDASLRRGKRRLSLLVALADLGGVWTLTAVTGALSAYADAAVAAALDAAVAAERAGPLKGLDAAGAGLFALAMGKHGARELNYSSDIDLICLFDDERWGDEAGAARARLIRVVQAAVKALSTPTADGYVFRTDLRLRPNPSTTPVCLSVSAAEAYYESAGRTWERAAFIKARPAAGDAAAGARFLDALIPFVWRRHLDFAAIEEAHGMLGKIRAQQGQGARLEVPGLDVKLGYGGIREIEFFAQTQQLVRGGRDPALRDPTTRGALAALAAAGVIAPDSAEALAAHYVAHRTLEHRLQMIEDAQTHVVPLAAEARARVAALAGAPDRETLETGIAARCRDVRAQCDRLYRAVPAPGQGPDLHGLGFADAGAARRLMDKWLGGGVPATRSERARRRFERLAPVFVAKLAEAGDPDEALLAFDRFLSGLPAGVQLFSLFEANPGLQDLLVEICAAAPALAAYLARNAGVLDSVLDRDFFEPLEGADALRAALDAALDGAQDHERRLDAVRRWAKERQFRVGVQVLRGLARAEEAGAGFSAIAETCLRALVPAVAAEFARRHGPPPGAGAAVVAMGKLGSAEMTASSDLDLIVIYDDEGAEESAGPKPLASPVYYARLTQMTIAALTAPTAEGALYAVDMRLRPSGRKGPVAVRLPAFERYQREDAWTWEHLALTRARVVAGDPAVGAAVAEAIATVRAAPRDAAAVLADVREMRGRVAEAHKAARDDPWALKHARGGLMDVDFCVQAGLLIAGETETRAAVAGADRLAELGWLSADDAAALRAAYAMALALQQVERVALDRPFASQTAGAGLKAAMARAVGAPDFAAVEARLRDAQAAAAAVVDARLGG